MLNFFFFRIKIQLYFINLRYIYTGELNLTDQSDENIFGLLIASDELLLEELFKHVQDYLFEKCIDWIQQNLVLILHSIFELTSFKKLQDYCLESICADPKPFFTSNNFPLLDKDILYELLKNDYLLVKEINAWDCLIKWGIEQTPGLGSRNSNRDKWNKENFEALKKTLSQFIPLIRFVEISRADFYDKVRPYKAVIPKHIYDGVKEFYYKDTLPKTTKLQPRVAKPVSTIIDPGIESSIADLIDKNYSNFRPFNNKYKFNLIYKKSLDGFDCRTFNDKCCGQGPFVVLIKDRFNIYGGYNPIGYARRTQWVSSSDSFIFSINLERRFAKFGRVINTSKSVWEDYNHTFFNFGNHIYINTYKLNICLQNDGNYDNIFHTNKSLPFEEIEVFSVVKN